MLRKTQNGQYQDDNDTNTIRVHTLKGVNVDVLSHLQVSLDILLLGTLDAQMWEAHGGCVSDAQGTHAFLAVLSHQIVGVGLVRLLLSHTRYNDHGWTIVLMDLKLIPDFLIRVDQITLPIFLGGKEYNYTHKTYDWFVQLKNALWHKVVLLGLRLSCMTLHCFVTYFDGWEGFSLWSAVFTRNASSWSSLTLIAETQPPGSWLFYNLHPGTCCLCSSGWLPAKTCPWPLHSWRSTGRAYVCVINSWEKKFINQLE